MIFIIIEINETCRDGEKIRGFPKLGVNVAIMGQYKRACVK